MRLYNFIFSNQPKYRLSRHLIFWIAFLLYFYYVNLFPAKPEDFKNIKTYSDAFELMIFFPISFISVYVTIYFILPAFMLTQRYMGFALAIGAFILINFSIAYLLTILLAKITTSTPFHQLPMTFRWFLPIRYGIGLPLTSAALTAIIKLLKTWHLKQKENEQLLHEKLKNEIQILKTQFQPHFLYDTLREISLLIQKNSTAVPSTLLKLSELLSYLLHEAEKEEVPLEQEIQMVKNFVSLKKTFYEKKLRLNLIQEGETAGQLITPMVLISFIENFFAHLIDSSPDRHSATIEIKTGKGELYFFLQCKKESGNGFKTEELWWESSLRKIELFYPYRHRFETYAENDTISVTLVLERSSNMFEKSKNKTVQYESA